MQNLTSSPLWTPMNTTYNSAHLFNGTICVGFWSEPISGDHDVKGQFKKFHDSFDPAAWSNGYPNYTISNDGCGSKGAHCVRACSDLSQVFASFSTLYSCLLAPYIAASLQHPDPSKGSMIPERNDTWLFDANYRCRNHKNSETASWFGIYHNSTFPDLVQPTIDCLSSYCEKVGDCRVCNRSLLEGLRGEQRSDVLATCYQDVCNPSDQLIDPDLGGVGVYISYIIQLAISLIAPLLIWLTSRSKSARSSTISMLGEFHRGQCIFTISIQIAAIVIARKKLLKDAQTKVLTNYSLLQIVAINSCITVPYINVLLTRYARPSWFRYGMTAAAFAMSLAAWATAVYFDKGNGHVFPLCGNTNPRFLCRDGPYKLGILSAPGLGGKALPAFVITFALICMFVSAALTFFVSLQKRYSKSSIPITLISLAQAGLGGVQLYSLAQFYRAGVDKTAWSFGQVVAIFVWVPAIVDFVHLQFVGMREGWKHRLPQDYAVVEDTEYLDSLPTQQQRTTPTMQDTH